MSTDKAELLRLAERTNNFFSEIAEIPQVKRGMVWCHQCGRSQGAGAECFRTGWPKCCGYTMSLDSPEERSALAAQQGEAK